MISRIRLESRGWRWSVLLVLAAAGCSNRSAETRLQLALSNAGASKTPVYPLAGTVTIDGEPPNIDANKRLILMLNDLEKPDIPVVDRARLLVKNDGRFTFTTYGEEDGIEPGHYVVTFVVLRKKARTRWQGVDQLNNLFNDPDVNAKIEKFVIDHRAPGKKDYQFDLKVAGQSPGPSPGPHALTASNLTPKG
jgi:hypothetical protein